MKKYYFISAFIFFIFSCCQRETNRKAEESTEVPAKQDSSKFSNSNHTSQNSLNYVGIYKGILPCVDCEGIATTIVLKENFTYSLKINYQGKGTKVFEEKGLYSWNKEGNTIVLNNEKSLPNQYLVGENTLIQLDTLGKKNLGELASNYILNKEMISSESSIVIEENASSEKLNNRMITKTVIKTGNPAEGKFALAKTHWKLTELNGKKVKHKGRKDYFIKLNSKDGKFNGFTGCNNFSGNYAMPSSFAISFMNIVVTMKSCPNMELETNFIKTLETADNYTIKGKILYLNKAKMAPLAKFEAIK